MKRFFGSAFGVAVLGCLVLAGWAVWSAGVFDSPVARQLRSASVYVAPGITLDQPAAERVIGNRRLVVGFFEPGADLSDACDSLGRAVDGTLAVMLSRDGNDYKKYSCSRLPGVDDENFGKAFVAESMIGTGIDGFTARPVDALKVMVVNYDLLVRTGAIPDGGRTVSPSLPRYLIATAAVAAVLLGRRGSTSPRAGPAGSRWRGRTAARPKPTSGPSWRRPRPCWPSGSSTWTSGTPGRRAGASSPRGTGVS